MTTECRRLSGLPSSATRRVTGTSRDRGGHTDVPVRAPDRSGRRRKGDVRDDLVDPLLELRRIRGHGVQDELLDTGVDPGLKRGDDLVGRAEQVDRLEVVRSALAAHDLEERAVLLL